MNGTQALLLISALLAGALIWALMRQKRAQRARKHLLRQVLSSEQRELVIDNFPLYALLPDPLRDQLDGLIHLFLDGVSFEACGDLTSVSEEMRLTIAAQACLLVLGHDPEHSPYPKLRSILVYPDAYRVREEGKSDSIRLGESWDRGSVVLAWQSVLKGGRSAHDGHNVTFHEFAHQLDSEDAATDGAPPLGDRYAYQAWSAVFSQAWEKFINRIDRGQPTLIDEYGATNHAEFFAVLVETFFERPLQLSRRYPEVYAQLCNYFKLDPLSWR